LALWPIAWDIRTLQALVFIPPEAIAEENGLLKFALSSSAVRLGDSGSFAVHRRIDAVY